MKAIWINDRKFNEIDLSTPNDIKVFVKDNFCGFGGTSKGYEDAEENGERLAEVIACINHDPKAIKSHWMNHPNVEHFEEDITKLYGHVVMNTDRTYGVLMMSDELKRMKRLVDLYRAFYPNAKFIDWYSLECTNFSKAKGGQPRDADSRTLADHIDRYIYVLQPDYVKIENVVEFMSWGPLDDKGKPVSRKSGNDYMRWRKHICSLGYYDKWREMNSADYGAYTSRNRLFGCFARPELPIIWPETTHAKKPIANDLFDQRKKWKAVKDVLDFDDEGISIFNRKKDLSPKTLERIYAGLIKYVAGGKEAFVVRYNSMSSNGGFKQTAVDVDNPCPTISTQNRLGMCFIAKYYSGKPEGKVIPVTGPAGTIKTADGQSLVMPKFIVQRNGGVPEGRLVSLDRPARTITATGGNQELVQCFLTSYYTVGGQALGIDQPAPTLTTKDRVNKIWLDKQYSGKHNHQPVSIPAGALPTVPKLNLVEAKAFVLNGNFGHNAPTTEPSPTLTASRRHHYIVNPSHGGHSSSVEAPCPVIIARQDKAPLYLVDVESADAAIPVYEDDVPVMVDIKLFMAMYGISDIKMRMLKVPELLKIQGFPETYKMFGNQTDHKKFIGNSVVPGVVKAWCEALCRGLNNERIAA